MARTRRDFLKTALGTSTVVSLGTTVPPFLARSALAAAASVTSRDTVLVVVQLSGGNDGLNTLVPYANDHYARNRPTLRLPANKVHKIGSGLGFHPRMGAFARLFKEGHLGVVQGVGYPKPAGDHESAMRVWQTGDPDDPSRPTGWLGRTVDQARNPNDAGVPAALVSSIHQPLALNAETTIVPRMKSLQEMVFHTDPEATGQTGRMARAAEPRRSDSANPLLEFVRQGTLAAHASSRRIEAVASRSTGAQGYPDFRLGQWLRTVAQLVRADLGIRIFYTELGGDGFGGFDNHANQLGNHGALLSQLSESTAAFADDLGRDKLLDRVVLMTFSEFGRTVAENGRRGTGHGSAAPMFLVGGKVRGGLVGRHPSLTRLENGGPAHHTDFRRVYAAMLDRWLGFDSRGVLGGKHIPVEVFAG